MMLLLLLVCLSAGQSVRYCCGGKQGDPLFQLEPTTERHASDDGARKKKLPTAFGKNVDVGKSVLGYVQLVPARRVVRTQRYVADLFPEGKSCHYVGNELDQSPRLISNSPVSQRTKIYRKFIIIFIFIIFLNRNEAQNQTAYLLLLLLMLTTTNFPCAKCECERGRKKYRYERNELVFTISILLRV
jgi:hypothetical protein